MQRVAPAADCSPLKRPHNWRYVQVAGSALDARLPTHRIRDLRDLVGRGGRVEVALPPNARVTGPLQKAFDDPADPLIRTDLILP